MITTKEKEKKKIESTDNAVLHSVSCCASKKCSDYDEECVDVKDPIACWFGGENVTRNGIPVFTERADGYCPLAQHYN
jgi:hypothetical protein